jgi:alpha-beta hydrolase superfamily lysophospholipase
VEGFFLSRDGVRIFYRRWEAQAVRAVCLLVHGLAEHSGRYEAIARSLNERGYSVWALDHRGHGRSGGRRGDCRRLEEFVGDVRTLAERARARHPDRPQVVIGHSLGGLIALTYAVRFPEGVSAVAVSSPALKLTHEPSPLKRAVVTAVARCFPLARFPNGVNPRYLSHDPTVVEAYRKDPLIFRTLTARCAVALDQAIRNSRALAKQLAVPCLILQAGSDEICDPLEAGRFAQAAAQAPVAFRRYDGWYHELFNEPDRQRIISDLCAWLDRTLGDGRS